MSTSFSQPEMSSFDLQFAHATSRAPSIVSLRLPHSTAPATAASSMLTVCPAEDEKDLEAMSPGPSAEGDDTADIRDDSAPSAVVPQVALTFLLVTGNRRTMSFDPETTIGRVKELVWNAWPSDWQDEKPPAPNFLRILYLGKILQNEDTLTSLSLPTLPPATVSIPTSPQMQLSPATIVHLSIRPYAPPTEDEALLKKNLRAARRALSRSASTAQPPPQSGTINTTEDGATVGGCCGCIIC
ncbi:uncharacterized protein FOMMEDRAFT_17724 [Fomitiporia mediterranea MF3/22]|uniref:uncharacterized protein n=1 Tax=Fomitiporia mediterranea (strain MF3/22) TaxID=694068 RepID=UPI00044086E5|nr:uncharacterized protein FOMMEDRAFT_17724 [Fomitiporia mediterranea MF3/22]EJD05413.1 hypothetical protein FOMMEDRAFT_17724 [Fomitiporia mediterranea MF3/22]